MWSCGNIENAVKKAKSAGGFALKIEVECGSKKDAEKAIEAGADVVMLDNLEPTPLKQIAKELKSTHRHILIEASGGITKENINQYFSEDVDIISMGGLTQSVGHIDFSLKIKKH